MTDSIVPKFCYEMLAKTIDPHYICDSEDSVIFSNTEFRHRLLTDLYLETCTLGMNGLVIAHFEEAAKGYDNEDLPEFFLMINFKVVGLTRDYANESVHGEYKDIFITADCYMIPNGGTPQNLPTIHLRLLGDIDDYDNESITENIVDFAMAKVKRGNNDTHH